jgi:hypothetical protein
MCVFEVVRDSHVQFVLMGCKNFVETSGVGGSPYSTGGVRNNQTEIAGGTRKSRSRPEDNPTERWQSITEGRSRITP